MAEHPGLSYVSDFEKTRDCELIAMAREVYSHLTDEISKEIFKARCLYAMTGDISAITGLKPEYRNLNSDMELYVKNLQKGQHCIVYGAGRAAHYLAGRFQHFGVHIDAFVEEDETKCGIDKMTGIHIISDKELFANCNQYGNKKFVISYSVPEVADKVKKRLCEELGVAEEAVSMGIYDWRNNASQYFDFFEPQDNEVFVDCGCYDGGTCYRFAGWCGHKGYEQIYTFEADPANYEKCKTLLKPLAKCELFPYGVAKKNEKVYFAAKAFEDSCIISEEEAQKKNFEGVATIETVALDDVLRGKKVTFLKMDVEGAEYDALLGAKQLISASHPRMAISIYHKLEDIITIPYLVLSMHQDYRISFRHYGFDELETIMYVE